MADDLTLERSNQPRFLPRALPLLAFHVVMAVLAVWLLWAVSVPGVALPSGFVPVLGLCVAAVVWTLWVVSAIRNGMLSWWFAIAPIGGAVVLALLVTATPLQARWELSEPAFDAAVADAERTPGDDVHAEVGDETWIGLYHIISATEVDGGYLFYEVNGALFDDAGFAYLPGGPTSDLEDGSFESPSFRHLGGHWYAFTASW